VRAPWRAAPGRQANAAPARPGTLPGGAGNPCARRTACAASRPQPSRGRRARGLPDSLEAEGLAIRRKA